MPSFLGVNYVDINLHCSTGALTRQHLLELGIEPEVVDRLLTRTPYIALDGSPALLPVDLSQALLDCRQEERA